MVISSVGKISFSALLNIIQKYFGSVSAKHRVNGRIRFNNYIPELKSLSKDTFQTHCVLGNIAYDTVHPKRIAMVLLNNILGGQSMNSRLNLALRERKGLAYNIESNYTAYSDTGLFNVYFGTDRENFDMAYDLVLKEFKLIREKKLGAVQLSKAKKQLIGQIAISTESHEDLMLVIGKSYLLYDTVDPLRVVFQKIDAVTADDLFEVANEILDKNNLSRLVYF